MPYYTLIDPAGIQLGVFPARELSQQLAFHPGWGFAEVPCPTDTAAPSGRSVPPVTNTQHSTVRARHVLRLVVPSNQGES